MIKLILHTALAVGSLFFLVIAMKMRLSGQPLSDNDQVFIDVGFGCMSAVLLYFSYLESLIVMNKDESQSKRLVSGVRVPMYIGASGLFVYWIITGM